jgi:hypothetical protein
MKLLVEQAIQDVEVLTENTATGKKIYLEGKFACVNEEVKNGRTYESTVWAPALKRYDEDYISQKRALSELGHPANPTVNLERVSHIIERLKIDESKNGVFGRARIIESTPMGAIAKALIEEGVQLGVSTRGLGSLIERNGKRFVGSDFVLNAIDIVSDPSGHGCMPMAMMENIEYEMLADGTIQQLAVDVAKKKIDEGKALKEFKRLMEAFKG